ncbi:MAG: Nif3-like dinuclear metal center hexameric protein, partial [Candidatus Thorarchaeota archaeon]
MDARSLYQRLDTDFELEKCSEDTWDLFDLGAHTSESFKKTRMGLVLDNTESIDKVYTAVFPSEAVIGR